jgi:hypothetical protein
MYMKVLKRHLTSDFYEKSETDETWRMAVLILLVALKN